MGNCVNNQGKLRLSNKHGGDHQEDCLPILGMNLECSTIYIIMMKWIENIKLISPKI